MRPTTRRARGIGLTMVGMLLGMLLITPATAHFTQNTRHLGNHAWNQVIKQKVFTKAQANNRFYTKGQANNRFVRGGNFGTGNWIRATATPGAIESAAQEAAPKIPLLSKGPLSVYAKCFVQNDTGRVNARIYIETSVPGAIFESRDGEDKSGGNSADDFLNPGTPENDRELYTDTRTGTGTSYGPDDSEDIHAMAPGGTSLNGQVQAAVKKGELDDGDFLFGPGDVCLFAGFAAS